MGKARSSAKIASELAKDIRTGFNCKFCKHQCFKVALEHWDEVQAWRHRSVHLTAGELDIEIEWIFGRSCARNAEIKAAQVLDDNSESTEMSPRSMADEATSQSEPERHTSHSAKRTKTVYPTASGSGSISQLQSSDEHTSASEDNDLLLIQQTTTQCKYRAAKKKQQYSKRKVTKQPSVQLQGPICKESVVLCRQAAFKVLSLGPARVHRVTLSTKLF